MRRPFHVYIKIWSILDCENPTCLIFLLSRIKSKLFHNWHVRYLTSWTWYNFIQFYFLTVSKYGIKTRSKQNTHNRQLSRNFANRIYFPIYLFLSEVLFLFNRALLLCNCNSAILLLSIKTLFECSSRSKPKSSLPAQIL